MPAHDPTTSARPENTFAIGTRFGRWTVIGPITIVETVGIRKRRRQHVLCRCDCGREQSVATSNLKCRGDKSRGCRACSVVLSRTRSGGPGGERLFRCWYQMVHRCTNSKNRRYASYGGRGITACQEWMGDFNAFRDWAIASGYRDGLSLERNDNDGPYSPDNCTWISLAAQAKNKRGSRRLTAFGETKILADWVRDPRCAVSEHALRSRIEGGWDVERSITAPADRSLSCSVTKAMRKRGKQQQLHIPE